MKRNRNTNSVAHSNDKHGTGKHRHTKKNIGITFFVAGLSILVLLLMLLIKLTSPVTFFGFLLDNEKNAEQLDDGTQGAIPDFSADSVLAKEHYHTFSVDPRETLAVLSTQNSYVREFRVINAYGGEADIQKYTLTVNGTRYRLESDYKTVLCDGNKTCTITETYRTELDGTVFTPEYEVGITSLADVKEAAEKGSVTYSGRTGEEKLLLIVSEDAESGVLSEYTVSVETGIVMTERSYVNGELYRAVVTDYADVFAALDLAEDFFEIPTE